MDALSAQSEKINFVPCIKWVKRGVAKSNPEKVPTLKVKSVKFKNSTDNLNFRYN